MLNAVAEQVGLGQAGADRACYRGLAQTMGFGSYVAACAEVSVSDEGELKIHRIVAATDCGHAVNPQQIEAQVEGSFVYGLSAALYGECTVKDGRIEQDNFDTYPVLQHGRDAEGRDDHHALGRLLGRRRRADDRGGGAGGAERDLRGHRQAHPRPAAEEPQPEEGVNDGGDGGCAALRLHARPCAVGACAAGPACAPSRCVGDAHPRAADRRSAGDAARGRAIVANRQAGLCLLCHSGPFPEERFQGNLAPDLAGAGARWSARRSCACASSTRARLNPQTIMPAVLPHRAACSASAPAWQGKPILSAQQIEDVVALPA